MKPSVVFAVLAAIFAVAGFTPAARAADSKDFPIKVHIISSEVRACGSPYGAGYSQCLAVLIDGKKYQLARINKIAKEIFPVHVGDYQARLVKDESRGTGEFRREYEIVFPDDKTASYLVTGEFE